MRGKLIAGGVAVAGMVAGVAVPAAASAVHPPRWVHVSRVVRVPSECGRRDPVAVVVWSRYGPDGDGGASALVCRDGKVHGS